MATAILMSFVVYAKAGIEDICIFITVANRGPEAAEIHVLPTLWFRNTWSWGKDQIMPALRLDRESGTIHAHHEQLGTYWLYCEDGGSTLFTENETNCQLLFNAPNASPYVKDAFHRYLVDGEMDSVNPEMCGTKRPLSTNALFPPATRLPSSCA